MASQSEFEMCFASSTFGAGGPNQKRVSNPASIEKFTPILCIGQWLWWPSNRGNAIAHHAGRPRLKSVRRATATVTARTSGAARRGGEIGAPCNSMIRSAR